MSEAVLVISDYIEGTSEIASIRIEPILKEISNKYKLFVATNYGLNSKLSSQYAIETQTYKSELGDISRKRNIHRDPEWNINNKENSIKSILKSKLKRNRIIKNLYYKRIYSYRHFCIRNNDFVVNIKKLIKRNNIRLVFVTTPTIYSLYSLSLIRNEFPEIKVIIEIRDKLNNRINNNIPDKYIDIMNKYIIDNSDKIICLSEEIAREYPNDKSVVIKNGFDENLFIELRKDIYNQDLKHLTFSHVGSIYEGRGIYDFISGVMIYSKKNSDINININFIGNIDDIGMKEIMKAKNKINKKIQINVLGVISHEEAINYIKESDINVILTHKSGSEYAIPGKVFEYIAAERPILAVTTDRPLIKIVDKNYGECASHNSQDIYEKINIILNSKYNFSDKMKFSRGKQVNSIMNVINDVMKECKKEVCNG